jgi:hypothetical protein
MEGTLVAGLTRYYCSRILQGSENAFQAVENNIPGTIFYFISIVDTVLVSEASITRLFRFSLATIVLRMHKHKLLLVGVQ